MPSFKRPPRVGISLWCTPERAWRVTTARQTAFAVSNCDSNSWRRFHTKGFARCPVARFLSCESTMASNILLRGSAAALPELVRPAGIASDQSEKVV